MTLGPIGGGDLLSDQGYIVYRNLELVSNFAPIEDASNFGLDGFYVISDAVVTSGDTLISAVTTAAGNPRVTWKSAGRVFQVEQTDDLTAPFHAISPIIPDLEFVDPRRQTSPTSFYRIRQW